MFRIFVIRSDYIECVLIQMLPGLVVTAVGSACNLAAICFKTILAVVSVLRYSGAGLMLCFC